MTRKRTIRACPHPWPRVGPLVPQRTALMVVDMQLDFCEERGYMGHMGYDMESLRAPIEPIVRVLQSSRLAGLHIIYTRQGYRSDFADVPRHKRACSSSVVGKEGPLGRMLVRNEPGWHIIPELAPRMGEPIVDKTANGAFYGTDLESVLRSLEVGSIAFCGNTIDVCVHTTLRDANDRGYECLLIEDCCGAVDPDLHAAAVKMVKVEDGVFGSVTDSNTFVQDLSLIITS